jgi:hypothetical protein
MTKKKKTGGYYIVIKITIKHKLSYLPWLQGVIIKHFFW